MTARRRALLIVIDAARRGETDEALAASSVPAIQDMARATLIAPSCWTVPCVGSMLTGLFPSEHGLRWPLNTAPPRFPTIAGLIERAGRSFRLLSGNNLCGPPLLALRDDQIYRPHDRWRPGVALQRTLAGVDYGSRAILNEVQRMAEARELPDLLMVHLQEPHHPYLAPPRGPSPAARTRYALGHLAYYLTTGAQVWEFAAEADEAAWRAQRERYLRCLHYAVGIAEDVIRAYDRRGALGETLVIITADHGEHLGEHGLADHQASLHEQLVNCPCAVLAPGLAPGTDLPGQFQHTDLLHTICTHLRVPTDGYAPAREPRDIVAAGGDASGHEHAFMEWAPWGDAELTRLGRRNPAWNFTSMSRELTGVRTRRWKYIRAGDDEERLYDLRADPAEERDLSAEAPEVSADLSSRLDRWLESVRAGNPGTLPGADGVAPGDRREVQKKLRSLGYL